MPKLSRTYFDTPREQCELAVDQLGTITLTFDLHFLIGWSIATIAAIERTIERNKVSVAFVKLSRIIGVPIRQASNRPVGQ